MLSVGAEVLMYKNLVGEGFNLLCPEFTCLEEELGYVELKNVSFDIHEDKRKVALDNGVPTVHAVAKGILVAALPLGFPPPIEYTAITRRFHLREIDYKPGHEAFFFTTDDSKEIYTAKHLYASNGKVKVLE